jgi:hypothetical protein
MNLIIILFASSGSFRFSVCPHCPTAKLAAASANNIGGQSHPNELCQPAIDVVYTWVNGSDERLLEGMFVVFCIFVCLLVLMHF